MLRTTEKLMAALSQVLTLASLPFLVLALWTPTVGAQDGALAFDLDPLRPADTSSPRATLRSFLTNINEFIERNRLDPRGDSGERPYLRALETLDLSARVEPTQNMSQEAWSKLLGRLRERWPSQKAQKDKKIA